MAVEEPTVTARTLIASAALAAVTLPALAANPHDGYAFWLPNGVLKVGDPASEKTFAFTRGANEDTFTVPLRRTRFDTPRGELVVVPVGARAISIFAMPRASEESRSIDVKLPLRDGAAKPTAYRFYWTDDSAAWPGLFRPDGAPEYTAGVRAFFGNDLVTARKRFQAAAKTAATPAQARLARRFLRWISAEERFPRIAKTDAKSYYNLGLYAMVNGFWELAEKSFKASTAANPKNPDAWYMLGDAASYVHSDLDKDFAQVYPYYKKAADLYPRNNSNTYRNALCLFRKLRVKENGQETVLTLTDEQIAETKLKWEWCTAVMESASRGALRFENRWMEFDREFDNTAELGHDPAPFEGLWEPGSVDTFMKFTGWGASDAIGHDCGPSRSASVNIGMREWDVLYHEWNHTLDWLMIGSGAGIGVPETHSSDWCGFQPISSMGMGHHSCNRYYMTPGMYRAIRGSDPPTTEWISEWLVSDPVALPGDEPLPATEAKQNQARAATLKVTSPLSVRNVPEVGARWALATAQNGWVDLKVVEPRAVPAAYTFAHVYVWSPADMKVRCWYGADDNARIWVNNRLAYDGVYWSVTKWEEASEKDQIAVPIRLLRGWNSVLLQVTNVPRAKPSDNPPHPFYYGRPDAWGFSVRFCDYQNRPIEGMRWQAQRPPMFDAARLTPPAPLAAQNRPVAPTFSWWKVRDDYTMDLPRLTVEDLRAVTGFDSLAVTNEVLIRPGNGIRTALPVLMQADPGVVALDNQVNWFFSPKETMGALRYKRASGETRDLVFLRPEMYEAFFRIARMTPEARKRGIRWHADQVIGYLTVPRGDSPNGRILLVVDTYLGDSPPVDEEDLLGM